MQFSIDEQLTTTKLVMMQDLNPYGTLFGGVLMGWMDQVAAILAMKNTCRQCVTVKFSEINFKHSIVLGDIVKLIASIVKKGKTSLTIEIKVFKSNIKEKDILVADAFAVFVALDEKGNPTNKWGTCCR